MKRVLIGITGGIGSGKSLVTQYLRRRGEHVICADEVAREVVEPGCAGVNAIRKEFGHEFFLFDGALDRAKLAKYVFSEAERVNQLNKILHPVIIDAVWKKTLEYKGRVFIDAALLIETGMHKNVDFVWVVEAEKETRIQRVIQRDSTTREAVERRMESQMKDTERFAHANEVIENNAEPEALYRQIEEILQKPQYCED